MAIIQSILERLNTKIKVMSDSIKKYNELVEDGMINPNTPLRAYTELELVETVANIARHAREDMPVEILYALAKDELAVKQVCD
jgi:DNA-binding transcriptional regulator YhcF (GntR family)